MVNGEVGSVIGASQVIVALHHQNLEERISDHCLTQRRRRVGKAFACRSPIPLLKAGVMPKNKVRHVALVTELGTHILVEHAVIW